MSLSLILYHFWSNKLFDKIKRQVTVLDLAVSPENYGETFASTDRIGIICIFDVRASTDGNIIENIYI